MGKIFVKHLDPQKIKKKNEKRNHMSVNQCTGGCRQEDPCSSLAS